MVAYFFSLNLFFNDIRLNFNSSIKDFIANFDTLFKSSVSLFYVDNFEGKELRKNDEIAYAFEKHVKNF